MTDEDYKRIDMDRQVQRFLDRVQVLAKESGIYAYLLTGMAASPRAGENDSMDVVVNTIAGGFQGRSEEEVTDLAHLISASAVAHLRKQQELSKPKPRYNITNPQE